MVALSKTSQGMIQVLDFVTPSWIGPYIGLGNFPITEPIRFSKFSTRLRRSTASKLRWELSLTGVLWPTLSDFDIFWHWIDWMVMCLKKRHSSIVCSIVCSRSCWFMLIHVGPWRPPQPESFFSAAQVRYIVLSSGCCCRKSSETVPPPKWWTSAATPWPSWRWEITRAP